MGGNGGIPCSSCQVLSIFVWDVHAFRVLVALGQSKIDNVDVIARCIRPANQEVVWLDVTMNEAFFVDLLDAADELDGDHEHSLEVELALAGLEQVLKGRSEEVHHHHMEALVGDRVVRSNVVQIWHVGLASELVDELGLPEEHWVPLILLCFFNLGCIELLGLLLLDLVDFSEGTAT